MTLVRLSGAGTRVGAAPAGLATACLVALAAVATAGAAGPSVRLHAALSPERLGGQTAVTTSFEIRPVTGRPLAPLVRAQLLYPAQIGFASSELGLESCAQPLLAARGPAACPRDSAMGSGSARVQVAFASRTISETARVAIFSQPVREGRLGFLFSAIGARPVIASLVFGGYLVQAGGPYGGDIDVRLPVVAAAPKGPAVVVRSLTTTIGGPGIVYSERVGGRTVLFRPGGLALAPRCPKGGFRFAVRLGFADESQAQARATVRCPRG